MQKLKNSYHVGFKFGFCRAVSLYFQQDEITKENNDELLADFRFINEISKDFFNLEVFDDIEFNNIKDMIVLLNKGEKIFIDRLKDDSNKRLCPAFQLGRFFAGLTFEPIPPIYQEDAEKKILLILNKLYFESENLDKKKLVGFFIRTPDREKRIVTMNLIEKKLGFNN